MATKGIWHLSGLAVLALTFASWVVLLAGVSGIQHDCFGDCEKTFRFHWFTVRNL